MPAQTWGQLAKSQDDDETIEEAIARLIAEHNEDEESHLAEGQSLQSHKAAEIIDHLAGSIVADKNSNSEYFIRSNFAEVGSWDVLPAGLIVKPYWCQFSISTTETEEILETAIPPFNPESFSERNLTFTIGTEISLGTDRYCEIHLYAVSSEEYEEYVGFEIRGFDLYAVASGSNSPAEVKLATLTNQEGHFFRFVCDSVNNKIDFYIRDTLIDSLDMPTFLDNYGLQLRIRLRTENAAAYAGFTGRTLLISSDVI